MSVTAQQAKRHHRRWLLAVAVAVAVMLALDVMPATRHWDSPPLLVAAAIVCIAQANYWAGWLTRDESQTALCRAEPPPPPFGDSADHPHWCDHERDPHDWHRCHGCALGWKLADVGTAT